MNNKISYTYKINKIVIKKIGINKVGIEWKNLQTIYMVYLN